MKLDKIKNIGRTTLMMAVFAAGMATSPVVSADEPFIGEVRWFAGNFAPRGWAFCDGQLLDIAQNSALFSLLGTNFGGDGRTTFGLPDLQGRAMVHQGHGPGLSDRRIGTKSGAETDTINMSTLATHSHVMKGHTQAGDSILPDDNVVSKVTRWKWFDKEPNTQLHTSSVSSVGGGQPHNEMQPSIALNCIIATQGVFPSRN